MTEVKTITTEEVQERLENGETLFSRRKRR